MPQTFRSARRLPGRRRRRGDLHGHEHERLGLRFAAPGDPGRQWKPRQRRHRVRDPGSGSPHDLDRVRPPADQRGNHPRRLLPTGVLSEHAPGRTGPGHRPDDRDRRHGSHQLRFLPDRQRREQRDSRHGRAGPRHQSMQELGDLDRSGRRRRRRLGQFHRHRSHGDISSLTRTCSRTPVVRIFADFVQVGGPTPFEREPDRRLGRGRGLGQQRDRNLGAGQPRRNERRRRGRHLRPPRRRDLGGGPLRNLERGRRALRPQTRTPFRGVDHAVLGVGGVVVDPEQSDRDERRREHARWETGMASSAGAGPSPSIRGNVIGGGRVGIFVSNTSNPTIQGNSSGPRNGYAATCGNAEQGILVFSASATIGGEGAGEGNVIAFNGTDGEEFSGGTSSTPRASPGSEVTACSRTAASASISTETE